MPRGQDAQFNLRVRLPDDFVIPSPVNSLTLIATVSITRRSNALIQRNISTNAFDQDVNARPFTIPASNLAQGPVTVTIVSVRQIRGESQEWEIGSPRSLTFRQEAPPPVDPETYTLAAVYNPTGPFRIMVGGSYTAPTLVITPATIPDGIDRNIQDLQGTVDVNTPGTYTLSQTVTDVTQGGRSQQVTATYQVIVSVHTLTVAFSPTSDSVIVGNVAPARTLTVTPATAPTGWIRSGLDVWNPALNLNTVGTYVLTRTVTDRRGTVTVTGSATYTLMVLADDGAHPGIMVMFNPPTREVVVGDRIGAIDGQPSISPINAPTGWTRDESGVWDRDPPVEVGEDWRNAAWTRVGTYVYTYTVRDTKSGEEDEVASAMLTVIVQEPIQPPPAPVFSADPTAITVTAGGGSESVRITSTIAQRVLPSPTNSEMISVSPAEQQVTAGGAAIFDISAPSESSPGDVTARFVGDNTNEFVDISVTIRLALHTIRITLTTNLVYIRQGSSTYDAPATSSITPDPAPTGWTRMITDDTGNVNLNMEGRYVVTRTVTDTRGTVTVTGSATYTVAVINPVLSYDGDDPIEVNENGDAVRVAISTNHPQGDTISATTVPRSLNVVRVRPSNGRLFMPGSVYFDITAPDEMGAQANFTNENVAIQFSSDASGVLRLGVTIIDDDDPLPDFNMRISGGRLSDRSAWFFTVSPTANTPSEASGASLTVTAPNTIRVSRLSATYTGSSVGFTFLPVNPQAAGSADITVVVTKEGFNTQTLSITVPWVAVPPTATIAVSFTTTRPVVTLVTINGMRYQRSVRELEITATIPVVWTSDIDVGYSQDDSIELYTQVPDVGGRVFLNQEVTGTITIEMGETSASVRRNVVRYVLDPGLDDPNPGDGDDDPNPGDGPG